MTDATANGLRPIPLDACDCHVHVFDPARFPYAPGRSYTPPPATSDELAVFERSIGMTRCVLVQPSPYGTDNAALLDALRILCGRARGVAVIDAERISVAELDTLTQAGVRGVRVNLEAHANRNPAAASRRLNAAAGRIADRGWHLQVFASLPVLAALAEDIAALPVPLVADHFAGVRAESGPEQPGFAVLLDLLRAGKVYVKLSAPYRASRAESYAELDAIGRALIDTAPGQLVWASDWPHTGGGSTGSNERAGRGLDAVEPFRRTDVPAALAQLSAWCGSDALWQRILVETPSRLYGF